MRVWAAFASGVLLSGCVASSSEENISLAENMVDGAAVWSDNCEGCHGIGVAGAPIAGDPAAWADRRTKDKSLLYTHAIEGFFGPKGTMMPARGGNEGLSDAQVKAAVDHMLEMLPDT